VIELKIDRSNTLFVDNDSLNTKTVDKLSILRFFQCRQVKFTLSQNILTSCRLLYLPVDIRSSITDLRKRRDLKKEKVEKNHDTPGVAVAAAADDRLRVNPLVKGLCFAKPNQIYSTCWLGCSSNWWWWCCRETSILEHT